jgi:hypothetical protein
MRKSRLLTLGLGIAVVASALVASAVPASAASAAGFYRVIDTDGTLIVQSRPAVGYKIGSVPQNAIIYVICQVNNGGTDVGDGGYYSWQYSRTWDEIEATDGTIGWVYDHFVSTPAQGADGYSPGVPHCYS